MKLKNTMAVEPVAVIFSLLALLVSAPANAGNDCEEAFKKSTASKTCSLQLAGYAQGSLCRIQADCARSSPLDKSQGVVGYTFYLSEVWYLVNDDGELKKGN